MEYNIVAKEIAQKVFKDSGLPNIGKASIREIKKLVDNLENASKVKFVRMEMGIPGLPPAQKGVEAQIESLQKGIASLYPDIEGMPKLKQEISRFVKNFIDIDVNRVLNFYPVAMQQMIAIARAIDTKCRILILDEPTSSLSDNEVERLFAIMRKLKGMGISIIFISHFLEQIYTICDRITVLRDGSYVGEYEIKDLPRIELISKMMGKEIKEDQIESNVDKSVPKDENVIEFDHVTVPGKVKDLSMTIKKGEVVGLGGLLGSGRSEIAETIFGIMPIAEGTIKVDDVQVSVKSPMDQMKNRIAFCPEDRKVQGIIGDLSVRENIILAMQAKDGMFKHMPRKKQNELADYYIDLLRIKVSDREQLIKNLSGGNQQKVIIARWLATEPNLLILDEPTRGIDVGTKTEIEALSVRLAKEKGMSVIFISGEMGEMVRTCSRVLIIRDHEKITELNGDEISTAHIMQAIAGDYHGNN